MTVDFYDYLSAPIVIIKRPMVTHSILPNGLRILWQDPFIGIGVEIFAGLLLLPGTRPRDQILLDRLSDFYVHGCVDLSPILEVAGRR